MTRRVEVPCESFSAATYGREGVVRDDNEGETVESRVANEFVLLTCFDIRLGEPGVRVRRVVRHFAIQDIL